MRKLTRREMLRLMGLGAAGAVMAGCATPTPEVIRETVEVEKIVETTVEVEKEVVVEKEVMVTAVPEQAPVVDVTITTSGWPVGVITDEAVEANPLDGVTRDAIQAYLDQNPGVKLEQKDVNIWDPEGIMAQVVGGTDVTYLYGPCVGGGWGRGEAVNAFVQGMLAEITPLVFKYGMHELSLPHLWENWSTNSQVDGKYFSYSLNEYAPSAGTLHYRKDLINEKGLKEPEIGWTWDEAVELWRALTDESTGMVGIGAPTWFMAYHLGMHGWDLLTQIPAPSSPWHWERDLTSDPRWVELCEDYHALLHVDKAILSDVAIGGGDEDWQRLFRAEQIAFGRFNYWAMFGGPGTEDSHHAMARNLGKDFSEVFGAVSLPTGDGYQLGSGVDIWGPVCFSPNNDAQTHDKGVGLVHWMFWGEGIAMNKQGLWEASKDPTQVYNAFLYMDGRESHPGVPATPEDAFGEALVQRWKEIGMLPIEPPPDKYYPAEQNPSPSGQAIDDQMNLMVTDPGVTDFAGMLRQGQDDWMAQVGGFASSVSEAQFVVASQNWYAAMDEYLKTHYPEFYENRFKPFYESRVLPVIS